MTKFPVHDSQFRTQRYGGPASASMCVGWAMRAVLSSLLLSLLLVSPSLTASPSFAQDIPTTATPQIEVVPTDSFNLKIVDRVNDHYIVVTPDPQVHNWFAATFTNLPTDAPVTIGLRMSGVATTLMDGTQIKVDLNKWVGLVPVMTYGDPTQYETYQCYAWSTHLNQATVATEGWWCDDPLLDPHDRYGGNKTVPQQRGVPQELAEQFLLKDQKHWEPWREVDQVDVLPTVQVFRITQQFDKSTATIAMRVPYTFTYQQQVIAKLRAAKLPGVDIDEIGTTANGRPLQIIRVAPPNATLRVERRTVLRGNPVWEEPRYTVTPVDPAKAETVRPLVLVTGAEYATGHASSWVAQSLLTALLRDTEEAKQARAAATYLIIPLEDPDGNVMGSYSRLPGTFTGGYAQGTYLPHETLMYACYLHGLVALDRPLVVSVGLDNLIGKDGVNIRSTRCMWGDQEDATLFNTSLFNTLQIDGLKVAAAKPIDEQDEPERLYGWCNYQFKSLALLYEINDRYPTQRMPLWQIATPGRLLAAAIARYLSSPRGEIRLKSIRTFYIEGVNKYQVVEAACLAHGYEFPRISDILQ
jgi:hypothetical protein